MSVSFIVYSQLDWRWKDGIKVIQAFVFKGNSVFFAINQFFVDLFVFLMEARVFLHWKASNMPLLRVNCISSDNFMESIGISIEIPLRIYCG